MSRPGVLAEEICCGEFIPRKQNQPNNPLKDK